MVEVALRVAVGVEHQGEVEGVSAEGVGGASGGVEGVGGDGACGTACFGEVGRGDGCGEIGIQAAVEPLEVEGEEVADGGVGVGVGVVDDDADASALGALTLKAGDDG